MAKTQIDNRHATLDEEVNNIVTQISELRVRLAELLYKKNKNGQRQIKSSIDKIDRRVQGLNSSV